MFHPGRMSESADYGAKMLTGRSCFRPILTGCVHLRYWAHRVKVKFRPKAIKTHAVRQGEPISKRNKKKVYNKMAVLSMTYCRLAALTFAHKFSRDFVPLNTLYEGYKYNELPNSVITLTC